MGRCQEVLCNCTLPYLMLWVTVWRPCVFVPRLRASLLSWRSADAVGLGQISLKQLTRNCRLKDFLPRGWWHSTVQCLGYTAVTRSCSGSYSSSACCAPSDFCITHGETEQLWLCVWTQAIRNIRTGCEFLVLLFRYSFPSLPSLSAVKFPESIGLHCTLCLISELTSN